MKILITTVGVSLLDNYISSPYNKRYPVNQEIELFNEKSVSDKDLYSDEYEYVYNLEEDYFTRLVKKNDVWHLKDEVNIWASAEIFSIINFYESNKKDDLKIYLIASDTLTSFISAELIKKFFDLQKVKKKYPNITVEKIEYIPNLKTVNISEQEIENSFFKLIEKVLELKNGQDKNVVLNITGGYKGFIPILAVIGQLEKLPLFYIYEKSEQGIVVSPFPLAIDWTYAELYGVMLKNTQLLSEEKYSEIKQELENLHLITSDNKLTLFGKLFKRYTDKYHAGERAVMFGHIMEFFFFKFVRNILKIKNVRQSFKPEDNIEVDLYSASDGFWAEVKSCAGLQKASEQVKRYYNYAKTNNLQIEKLVIFLYKFEFEDINDHFRILRYLDVWAKTENINFEIYLYDLPFNTRQGKKGKININQILNTDFGNVSYSEISVNNITFIKFYKIENTKN